jgi:hypothetical protein
MFRLGWARQKLRVLPEFHWCRLEQGVTFVCTYIGLKTRLITALRSRFDESVSAVITYGRKHKQ